MKPFQTHARNCSEEQRFRKFGERCPNLEASSLAPASEAMRSVSQDVPTHPTDCLVWEFGNMDIQGWLTLYTSDILLDVLMCLFVWLLLFRRSSVAEGSLFRCYGWFALAVALQSLPSSIN